MTSTNIEITNGNSIDQTIRTDYVNSIKRVERANPTMLRKRVNVDILAKIVERRLLDLKFVSKGLSKEKKSTSGTISSIIGILCSLGFFYLMFAMYKNGKRIEERNEKARLAHEQKQIAEFKNMLGPKKEDAFVFEDASRYQNINYFGKEDIVSDVISHIVNILKIMSSNNQNKLKMLKSPQKNFLLSGPPGTGKTLFVQKIVGLLDTNLKALEMKDKVSKLILDKMTIKEKFDYLKKIPSKVRAVFLTPSFINDKFVGESEKRVRELFRLAAAKSSYEVTILFFDEMDAFFVDRNSSGNESHIRAQTEFLSAIGGVQDDIKRTVFCFGATNRPTTIDKAFNRRFANKIAFLGPQLDEAFKLVSSYTSSWEDYSDEKALNVAKLMIKKKMYQSGIVEMITAIYLYLDELKIDKWEYLLRKLNSDDEKNNSKGFENTLNSYPKEKSTLNVLNELFK